MAPVVERRKPIQFAKGHQFEGTLPGKRNVAQPKLDGLRMLLDVDNNVALTLTGLPIPNAAHILKEMRDSGKFPGVVIDAEGLCEDWNLSQSIIKTQSEHPRASELKAYCFDRLARVEQWEAKQCREAYEHRYNSLADRLRGGFANLVLVPNWLVTSAADVECLSKHLVENGWNGIVGGAGIEGVMIKDLDAPYAFRKNNYWLKKKPLYDADLVCIGATEGRGKQTGMLGAFKLKGQAEWRGQMVDVETETGTGCKENNSLRDEVRIALWQQHLAGELAGRIVEIRHEGLTTNNALRFPRFYRLRTDKDAGLA